MVTVPLDFGRILATGPHSVPWLFLLSAFVCDTNKTFQKVQVAVSFPHILGTIVCDFAMCRPNGLVLHLTVEMFLGSYRFVISSP